MDAFMMFTFQISVFIGFILIVVESYSISIFLLILSIMFSIPMNNLLLYNINDIIVNYDSELSHEIQIILRIELSKLRKKLSVFICIIFPFYSIVYICSINDAFNNEITIRIIFNRILFQ